MLNQNAWLKKISSLEKCLKREIHFKMHMLPTLNNEPQETDGNVQTPVCC